MSVTIIFVVLVPCRSPERHLIGPAPQEVDTERLVPESPERSEPRHNLCLSRK